MLVSGQDFTLLQFAIYTFKDMDSPCLLTIGITSPRIGKGAEFSF